MRLEVQQSVSFYVEKDINIRMRVAVGFVTFGDSFSRFFL